MSNLIILYIFYWILFTEATLSSSSTSSTDRISLYKIEGQIVFPPGENALDDVRILVDEGQYVGIPRVDGTFVISGVPSGSYIVSVSSPFLVFEPVRVEINTKGKIRARTVNFIEPGKVVIMKYPLHFEVHDKPNYFKKREVFRVTDYIFNPMFLFPIVIVLSIYFLPKLPLQDQDMQENMQGINNLFQPRGHGFDITDFLIKIFGAPRRIRPINQDSIAHETTAPASVQKKKKASKQASNKKH